MSALNPAPTYPCQNYCCQVKIIVVRFNVWYFLFSRFGYSSTYICSWHIHIFVNRKYLRPNLDCSIIFRHILLYLWNDICTYLSSWIYTYFYSYYTAISWLIFSDNLGYLALVHIFFPYPTVRIFVSIFGQIKAHPDICHISNIYFSWNKSNLCINI